MGCEQSASIEEKVRGVEQGNNSKDPKGNNKKGHVWVTVDDAVLYVQKELRVSESKAKQLVGQENVDNDGRMADEELLQLFHKIKAMKETLGEDFKEFDKDTSGVVTTMEAVGVLVNRFEGADDKALLRLIKRFDENNDGSINYDEFVIFYCFVSAKKDELIRKFDEMDRDKSGLLDAAEVRQGLKDMCGMDERQAYSVVDEFDVSMDDKINKQEFNNMWLQLFPDNKSEQDLDNS